ncbi:MAG: hypothetical protein FWG77_02370 [Treponema sp.]|nr:hypothetical protein [Treponema sp.]
MSRSRFLIILCFLLLFPLFAYSQTAQRIETLLSSDALNYEQVVQFVFDAAELSYGGNAFQYALEQNWLPRNAAPGAPATLSGVSLVVMQAFEINGGIFYSIFRNPHYAYRELVYRNIIIGRADPAMFVSGYDFLYIVNRVLAFRENELL